jgi:hypothetical protein
MLETSGGERMTYQIGDTRRPLLDVSVYDGSTVVTLNVVSEALGTTTPVTLTGPVVQPGGAGRWTAAADYTIAAAGHWVERWNVTNAVTGLGAGTAFYEFEVEATPPASGPGQTAAWATVTQYAQIIGNPIPTNLPAKLRAATLTLRRHVALGLYDATAAATLAALAEACCLQVAYAAANGWESGAPIGQRAVSIGSVTLGAVNSQAGGSAGVSPVDPLAYQVLEDAGLTTAHIVTDGYPWWT